MAEEASGEKVFPASARKRREARKKGQVAKSPELTSALVMMGLVVAVRMATTNGIVFNDLSSNLHNSFAFNPSQTTLNLTTIREWQRSIAFEIAQLVGPAMAVALVIALISNIAQVGLVITPEALVPDMNRVNPANAFKRMFSVRGTVELVKGILKICLIGWISYSTLRDNIPSIVNSLGEPFVPFIGAVGDLVWSLGIHVTSALLILAALDYGYQRYDFEKTMKMTRDEMKQEMKQSDGDPFIKQRIRQKQRQMAQKRMMQEVPTATVVVTNPTHFAVALRYDKAMGAPKVVARGQDLIALRIKEIAKENGVPTVENRPVARALFNDVRLGAEIPGHLYQAVAEILAFVYKMKKAA
jgi:flagellar biosynthetic protein FlhB